MRRRLGWFVVLGCVCGIVCVGGGYGLGVCCLGVGGFFPCAILCGTVCSLPLA